MSVWYVKNRESTNCKDKAFETAEMCLCCVKNKVKYAMSKDELNMSLCYVKARAHIASKRATIVTVDKAISTFLSQAKFGPEFVCVCCNRLIYKQVLVPYNKAKYTKASNELLEQVFHNNHSYINSDGKQWVCKMCYGGLVSLTTIDSMQRLITLTGILNTTRMNVTPDNLTCTIISVYFLHVHYP